MDSKDFHVSIKQPDLFPGYVHVTMRYYDAGRLRKYAQRQFVREELLKTENDRNFILRIMQLQIEEQINGDTQKAKQERADHGG